MRVGGQRHDPAALSPGKRPANHCTGGWVGPKARLDGCGKSPPTRFDPQTVQPVASRCTDWAILVQDRDRVWRKENIQMQGRSLWITQKKTRNWKGSSGKEPHPTVYPLFNSLKNSFLTSSLQKKNNALQSNDSSYSWRANVFWCCYEW